MKVSVFFVSMALMFAAPVLSGAQSVATERVSVDGQGNEAAGQSTGPSISADGRYVAFISNASNLAGDASDSPTTAHAFLKDRLTGEVRRASRPDESGVPGGVDQANIIHTAISDEGRFVAFNVFNGGAAVYDRDSGDIREIPESTFLDLSGNGRSLSYVRESTYYVHDLVDDVAEEMPPGAIPFAMSFDARDVALRDFASRIVVLDRQTGATEVVSVNGAGDAVGSSDLPSISNDGRYVAFESRAANLAPGDTPDTPDVFVRDRQIGETILVSKGADGKPSGGVLPQISAEGRHVAYVTSHGNGILLVHDLDTGIVEKVSVNNFGEDANDRVPGVTGAPQDLSADGRFIAFESNATNLVDGDTNNNTDIFVHDREAPISQRPPPPTSVPSPGATVPSPGTAVLPGAVQLPALGGEPTAGNESAPSPTLIALAATIVALILVASRLRHWLAPTMARSAYNDAREQQRQPHRSSGED